MLPRPDLAKNLDISYRRIPLLAVGSSVYADTRLILPTLESLYPAESTPNAILQPLPNTPEARALTGYLSTSVISGEAFARAAQLIPLSSPVWSNPAFLKDRAQLSGREWSKQATERARPEAVTVMRNFFGELENGLLADGREWLLNTKMPTIADIEAVWVPAWLIGMKDALPEDVLGPNVFPKVYAYTNRFLKLVAETRKKAGKVERLDGKAAAKKVLDAKTQSGVDVNQGDPLGLEAGQEVSVWPIDSGFSHKDQGKLVKLVWNEVVIEKNVDSEVGKGNIRLHFPRTGFRVAPAEKARL